MDANPASKSRAAAPSIAGAESGRREGPAATSLVRKAKHALGCRGPIASAVIVAKRRAQGHVTDVMGLVVFVRVGRR